MKSFLLNVFPVRSVDPPPPPRSPKVIWPTHRPTAIWRINLGQLLTPPLMGQWGSGQKSGQTQRGARGLNCQRPLSPVNANERPAGLPKISPVSSLNQLAGLVLSTPSSHTQGRAWTSTVPSSSWTRSLVPGRRGIQCGSPEN